ncbi:MAG: LPS export ABC transporter permease LptG [Alphaproteobacteria bacterium]|nr:LPS export ABC transporter permease LptG [Alphaproteobacteria bacterium]
MRIAAILSAYVGRQFLISVLSVLAMLLGIVVLFDLIEFLRRAINRPDLGFWFLVQLAVLRVPFMALQLLPFAVLFGGILAFWRLTRSSELVVARAAGVSAWQFLAAPVALGAVLGLVAIMLVNPIASAMFGRAERLDSEYLRSGGSALALTSGGLWLRQADRAAGEGAVAIVHAGRVARRENGLDLEAVSIFRIAAGDRFTARLEAESGRLEQGRWALRDVWELPLEGGRTHHPELALPTDLTLARVQDSFAPPDTLSFWTLPGFIEVLEQSGFSALRHKLHFQSLLALPLLLCVMVLLAAGFSMRPSRRGGVMLMIGGGIVSGFALYVLTRVVVEFGQSGAIPVALAAWAPAGMGLMLAVALLLHLEDG